MVQITVEQVNKRVPVVAGAGSNSTAEAIDLAKHAKQVGADAALLVTPLLQQAHPGGHLPALRRPWPGRPSSPWCPTTSPAAPGTNIEPATLARHGRDCPR